MARREAEGIQNADFMVLDAAGPRAGELLLERLGPANIFVRGVFHVLKPGKQAAMAANLRTVIGDRGRVLLAETNFRGSSLGYLAELGASRRSMPLQLQRALENLPRPGHFGARERHSVFLDSEWQLIADGPVDIEVVPLNSSGISQWVPGYYALLSGAEDSRTEHERV